MRTILALILTSGLAAGCGAARPPGGAIRVVAAENAYGDIAAQLGGAHVAVTSLLSEPNADPHLFQPGTSAGLAVAEAKVLIVNGAGYDTFASKLATASPSGGRIVVTVADLLGDGGRGTNPHFWYDVPALPGIAATISRALEQADPAHAAAYRAGLRRFTTGLQPLVAVVRSIRARFAGLPVASTEPVPGYLVDAAGLRELAPSSFTRAIEDGTEPAPQAVAAMEALLRRGTVRALLYNSQAVSPLTARLRDLAQRAGIPVVAVTETLPPGLRFQDWQLAQARALRRALAR